MGCCLSTPVDFEGEVNLYHFDLHRVVGKGAFGKVSIYVPSHPLPAFASGCHLEPYTAETGGVGAGPLIGRLCSS